MTNLNRNRLQEEFNLDPNEIEREAEEITKKINEDPVESLKENIARANFIADYVEREIANGNLSARMVEVLGQIINSITNANKEIIGSFYGHRYLQLREKMLELKSREIDIKEQKNRRPTNQNIIVTDRESVLKMLEDNRQEKQENKKEKE